MSIKINYLKKIIGKSSSNLILFADEKFNIKSLRKYLSNSEFSYISDLLKTSDLKKNLFVFEFAKWRFTFLLANQLLLDKSILEIVKTSNVKKPTSVSNFGDKSSLIFCIIQ